MAECKGLALVTFARIENGQDCQWGASKGYDKSPHRTLQTTNSSRTLSTVAHLPTSLVP